MKQLTKYIGGSQLYGLSTPESDIDLRGVYLHEDMSDILRFTRPKELQDNITTVSDIKDEVYFSLWRYLDTLRKSNIQGVESLYVKEDDFLELDPAMKIFIEQPQSFIDSNILVSSIKGYTYSEYKLAMGHRTGRLGGARKENIDKYGFSPKNVTQIIRITEGLLFLQANGFYPLNIREYVPEMGDLAFEIKTNPSAFTKDHIDIICNDQIKKVENVEDKLGWKFDEDLAISVMKDLYKPYFQ